MQSEQCMMCKHYEGQFVCSAYHNRIPDEILVGDHDHTKPYKGDNGIQFEPIKGG
jgi:hypothetical protein